MVRFFLSFVVAAVILFAGCSNNAVLYDLKCENIVEPVGIGTYNPRFSWKLKSDKNGTRQTAYQLLIASGKSLLKENKADIYNSGKIMSSASVLVPFDGEKLASGFPYYWTVRVWDENDRVSSWAPKAFFSIGLLERQYWKSDYIGLPSATEEHAAPLLWKSLDIKNVSGRFFLHVNSLGYHEVFVNGNKVGNGVLSPAVVQFNKRTQAITYDVSEFIVKGRNDIVLWINKGWYSKGLLGVTLDYPVVRAQFDQVEGNKRTIICCTDASWKGRQSGYIDTGTWRSGQFGGELIVGSQLLKNLSASSLDHSSWTQVTVADLPNLPVTHQMSEKNIISEEFHPVSITGLGDGSWLIDMGTNLTGWLNFKFKKMQPGIKINMEYCDHLDDKGQFVNRKQTDQYVTAGKDDEIFMNKFNYHGFRYIRVSNLPYKPDPEDIAAYLIQTGFASAASFKSSDDDLNKIHDMIQYTLRCLSLGGYLVDCPQLERLGYGGDGNASTATAQMMFDLNPLYNNWLQAWSDCAREDGCMPHTAPFPHAAGGGPYWCGFIITASWNTYLSYGDSLTLKKYYPVMQKWLEFVEKNSPDGLLVPWPSSEFSTWFLGDWATPKGINQTDPNSISVVNNCFVSVCYETMSRISKVLDKPADASHYKAMADTLKHLIHEKYFHKDDYSYGSGSQIDNIYPLLAGVVPDEYVEEVTNTVYKRIENDKGHLATGLVGIPVITEWAVKNQEVDLMFSMLKKQDYPGYLYMINHGATTTWEHWDGKRSRIHNCYNGIGSWFYMALGGICMDTGSSAYKHFIIRPQIPESLSWVKVEKETPYGKVSVYWEVNDDGLLLNVGIPVGSTAKVVSPEGYFITSVNDTNTENPMSSIDAESGIYHLLCVKK